MEHSATANAAVLVVEDDPSIGRAVTRALSRAGYPVLLVRHCRAALKLERSFEVAVLDLDLPDGSGLDLAEQLLDSDRSLVVLFFSATDDRKYLARAAELGEVVRKGAELSELIEAVSRARAQHATGLRVARAAQSHGR